MHGKISDLLKSLEGEQLPVLTSDHFLGGKFDVESYGPLCKSDPFCFDRQMSYNPVPYDLYISWKSYDLFVGWMLGSNHMERMESRYYQENYCKGMPVLRIYPDGTYRYSNLMRIINKENPFERCVAILNRVSNLKAPSELDRESKDNPVENVPDAALFSQKYVTQNLGDMCTPVSVLDDSEAYKKILKEFPLVDHSGWHIKRNCAVWSLGLSDGHRAKILDCNIYNSPVAGQTKTFENIPGIAIYKQALENVFTNGRLVHNKGYHKVYSLNLIS